MIKTRYRDYAVSAWEFFGRLGCPRSVQLAEYRLKEYILKSKLSISDAQYKASLDDLVACVMAYEEICRRSDADDVKAALTIYTQFNHNHRGNIESGILSISAENHISPPQIYRKLTLCRDLFAIFRGLRMSA